MTADVVKLSPDARALARTEQIAADLRAACLGAVKALEEGRRGDALSLLRSASRKTITVPTISESDGAA